MIKENVKKILEEIPPSVKVVAAAKKHSIEEIEEAIEAGISLVGENYIQEAEKKIQAIGKKVKWHLIGGLQKNKAKKAVSLFDMIETVDSLPLAVLIDKECQSLHKKMPILVEINSASEPQKRGILPKDASSFLEKLIPLKNIEVSGLMTMGPFLSDPEKLRPYFKKTKKLFVELKEKYREVFDFQYISMGMSDSYRVAIEEGANIVRIGTKIFGPRPV